MIYVKMTGPRRCLCFHYLFYLKNLSSVNKSNLTKTEIPHNLFGARRARGAEEVVAAANLHNHPTWQLDEFAVPWDGCRIIFLQ
jgi:hypothetical protein